MFDPQQFLRPHLKGMTPYSSARDDYKGRDGVFLDANENPYGAVNGENWNRYPDPYQTILKEKIAGIKGVAKEQIFLGNGSDEAIDLLFRAFCEPGRDNVIINPPTYGMYKVSADINNVQVREVSMTPDYDLNIPQIFKAVDANTRLIFICSPNNPTGNEMTLHKIDEVIKGFEGIVIVDEAYIDFTNRPSYITKLAVYPNLVVLQTFSKAWGLAALRLGMAFGSREMLDILNKIKAPYNLSGLTQATVLKALEHVQNKNKMVSDILVSREKLKASLLELALVTQVCPSDANFLLVKIPRAAKVYKTLIAQQIILRDRSKVALCENGIRITVGTPDENKLLIKALKKIVVS